MRSRSTLHLAGRRIAQAKQRLTTAVAQLEKWLRAPGPAPSPPYSLRGASADSVLADGYVLPWRPAQSLADRLATLVTVATAEFERCGEELQIVIREAADLVEFRQQYLQQLATSTVISPAVPWSVDLDGMPAISETAKASWQRRYIAGLTALRQREHARQQSQLAAALIAQDQLLTLGDIPCVDQAYSHLAGDRSSSSDSSDAAEDEDSGCDSDGILRAVALAEEAQDV